MKKILDTVRPYAVPAVAITALFLGSSGVLAQDAEVLTLEIEPQKAGPALMELASSSGVQIMLPDQVGAQVEVGGLKASTDSRKPWPSWLTDTGLEYEYNLRKRCSRAAGTGGRKRGS